MPAEAPGNVQSYSENASRKINSTITTGVEAQNVHIGGYCHTEAVAAELAHTPKPMRRTSKDGEPAIPGAACSGLNPGV